MGDVFLSKKEMLGTYVGREQKHPNKL